MRQLLLLSLLLALAGTPANAAHTATELQPWLDAGFAADDARFWSDAGFGVHEASHWREFANSYEHRGSNNLQEAQRWSGWGYSSDQAQMFMHDLDGTVAQAREMAGRGMSAHAAINALRGEKGLQPLPDPSFDLRSWTNAGFAADDARLWYDAGFQVEDAADWRDFVNSYSHRGNNNLQEARRWSGWGYTPSLARMFMHDYGGSAAQAQEMANRGFSARAAINELRYGGSVPPPDRATPGPGKGGGSAPGQGKIVAPTVPPRAPPSHRQPEPDRTPTRPRPPPRDVPAELLRNIYMSRQQQDGWVYYLNFCADGTVRIAHERADRAGFSLLGEGRWSWGSGRVDLDGPWDVMLGWAASAEPNQRLLNPGGGWMANSAEGTARRFWRTEYPYGFDRPGC